jgi:4-hydroxybenzoate polyprenyltransferase
MNTDLVDSPGRELIPSDGARVASSPLDWVTALRPRQWVKNLFVVMPLVFSGRAGDGNAVLAVLGAFLLFSQVASAVYLINDVVDRDADRVHPVKRFRPVASGRIAPNRALLAGLVLGVTGMVLGWVLAPAFGVVAVAYVGMNLLYTFWLKEMVILDVFTIAAFFLLRLIGGSVVIGVRPSLWLLLCGGLLALFLGFAKRRHELILLEGHSRAHRSVLADYSPGFLDQMSTVLLSVTVVSYIMYTLNSPTVHAEVLAYSTVFVLFGAFRYLYLVHQRQGGNPTETLLTDRPLLITVVLWLAYCGWAVYRPF